MKQNKVSNLRFWFVPQHPNSLECFSTMRQSTKSLSSTWYVQSMLNILKIWSNQHQSGAENDTWVWTVSVLLEQNNLKRFCQLLFSKTNKKIKQIKTFEIYTLFSTVFYVRSMCNTETLFCWYQISKLSFKKIWKHSFGNKRLN